MDYVEKTTLEEIVKNSTSYSQCLDKLQWSHNGNSTNKLKKLISLYNLTITHFTGQAWNKGENFIHPNEINKDIKKELENIRFIKNDKLIKKLIRNNLKTNKCDKCNSTDIEINLFFTDGDTLNYKLENLQFLCKECFVKYKKITPQNHHVQVLEDDEEKTITIRSNGRVYIYLKKDKKMLSYPRYIMEQHLERPLLSTEQIHHKDNNPLNNDIDNLEIKHLGEHQKEHTQKYFDKEAICGYCGKTFLWKAKSQIDFYRNRNKKGKNKCDLPLCSKSCVGKYTQKFFPKNSNKPQTKEEFDKELQICGTKTNMAKKFQVSTKTISNWEKSF